MHTKLSFKITEAVITTSILIWIPIEINPMGERKHKNPKVLSVVCQVSLCAWLTIPECLPPVCTSWYHFTVGGEGITQRS